MSKVTILTHVDLSASGVVVHAIRAAELAAALGRHGHDVRILWAPDRGRGAKAIRRRAVREAASSQVVIISSTLAGLSSEIKRHSRSCAVVVDLFDAPLVGIIPDLATGVRGEIEFERYRLAQQFGYYDADRFLCATPEQRLWLLGVLSAWGRLNPATYSDHLVMVLPTGVPRDFPVDAQPPLFRGRIVPADAIVILWPGGVYSHYRPIPLLDALAKVLVSCRSVYVVFVGASNAAFSPDNTATRELYDRAAELNRDDTRVFFEPGLPYDQRHRMYVDADLAVCLFEADLETELSFRTRLIDILWGGLPVVMSRGNELSRMIEEAGSGYGVDDLNPDELLAALLALLVDPARRRAMGENARRLAAEELRWDDVVAPLDQYCQQPSLASDADGVSRRFGLSRYSWVDRALRVGLLRLRQKLCALGLST